MARVTGTNSGFGRSLSLAQRFSGALTIADRAIERMAREEAATRRLRYSRGELRIVTFLQNGVALLVSLSYIQ